MSDKKLGQIIEGEAERDAIHVAIAPVIAAEPLLPGMHVGLLADGTCGRSATSIGVVDPFLTVPVLKGQKFWLCLYQQTITGMRHHWQHPAFTDEPKLKISTGSKEISEAWLRHFCDNGSAPSYETLIAAAVGERGDYWTADMDGDYFSFYGTDAHGEIPAEFWTHLEIVTGKTFPNKPSYFSCSC